MAMASSSAALSRLQAEVSKAGRCGEQCPGGGGPPRSVKVRGLGAAMELELRVQAPMRARRIGSELGPDEFREPRALRGYRSPLSVAPAVPSEQQEQGAGGAESGEEGQSAAAYRVSFAYGPGPVANGSGEGGGLGEEKEREVGGGGGFGGGGEGGGGGGGGGGDGEGGGGEEEEEKAGGMSVSQRLTLAYAGVVGAGGLMGYLKSGSTKSLFSGLASAGVLLYVYTQLPVNPVFASSIGLGVSVALLTVMGTRYRNSGKVMPAGLVALLSFIMSGGYVHGIIRSAHSAPA